MQKTSTSVYQFGLLWDTNLKLRVNFDCYTARPHFIIVSDDLSITTYQALCDDQKKKVIELALLMATKDELKGSRAVLSQHSGSWYSSKHNYHAHLCVESGKYLNILEDNLEKLKFWPKHLSYDKIEKYPDREDEKKKEVTKIQEIIKDKGSPEATEEAHNVTMGNYSVLFHLSEPRVGFVVEESEKPAGCNDLLDVQKEMMRYASENVLTKDDVDKDYQGCHVCLVLDGQKHGKSTLVSELNNLRRN